MSYSSSTVRLTPAEQAMACLYETQNGYAVRRGCREEFAQIPCEYEEDAGGERDLYTFDDGEGDYLALSVAWKDEEVFLYS